MSRGYHLPCSDSVQLKIYIDEEQTKQCNWWLQDMNRTVASLPNTCMHTWMYGILCTCGWYTRAAEPGGARGARPPILDFHTNNRLLCSLSRQPSQSYFCSATTVDTFMSLWWLPSFQVLKIRGCTTLASFPGLPGSSFWLLAVCRNRGMFTNQIE